MPALPVSTLAALITDQRVIARTTHHVLDLGADEIVGLDPALRLRLAEEPAGCPPGIGFTTGNGALPSAVRPAAQTGQPATAAPTLSPSPASPSLELPSIETVTGLVR